MILPFDPHSGLVIIPVRVRGPKEELITRFAIDTGATQSVLKQDYAMRLGYILDESAGQSRIATLGSEGAKAFEFWCKELKQ